MPTRLPKVFQRKNPQNKKISAGKLFFQKLREGIENHKSLLIESTLSGRYLQKFLTNLKSENYRIRIVFLFADSPEILIERIAERVKKGGHFVADEDVKRRFVRGKQNFRKIYKDLADSWSLIYNAEGRFYKVAFGENELIKVFDENIYEKFLQI